MGFIHCLWAQNGDITIDTKVQEPPKVMPGEDSLSLANAYFKKGITQSLLYQNYKEGINSFTKSIGLYPENSTAYYNRGYAYMKLNLLDEAISDFNKSVDLNSKNKKAYLNLGKCWTLKDDQNKAIETYGKALALDSNYAAVHYNLGISFGAIGEKEKALNSYTAAIKNDPDKSNYYFNRAMLRQELGDMKYALEDFQMASKLDPDDPNILFAMGFLYLNQQNAVGAIESFNSTIDMDSSYWNAYFNRGLIFLEQLDFEKATVDLNIYTENIKDDPFGFFYAGKANMEMGDMYLAMEDFESSVKLNPDFGWSNYYLGYIMINSFGKFEGCTYLEKAKALGVEEAERTIKLACINK